MLSAVGREKFLDLAPRLSRNGILTELDVDGLTAYCVIYARWVEAEGFIKTLGPIVETTAGNMIQNPYLSIANRCLEQMNRIAGEFGLTPSSRARLKGDTAPPDDPLEQELFGPGTKVSG